MTSVPGTLTGSARGENVTALPTPHSSVVCLLFEVVPSQPLVNIRTNLQSRSNTIYALKAALGNSPDNAREGSCPEDDNSYDPREGNLQAQRQDLNARSLRSSDA